MGRNAIGALAILLCTLVIGAVVLHERCRLGKKLATMRVDGNPACRRSLSAALNEGDTLGRSSVHASLRPA
jgi:hypothetical protein